MNFFSEATETHVTAPWSGEVSELWRFIVSPALPWGPCHFKKEVGCALMTQEWSWEDASKLQAGANVSVCVSETESARVCLRCSVCFCCWLSLKDQSATKRESGQRRSSCRAQERSSKRTQPDSHADLPSSHSGDCVRGFVQWTHLCSEKQQ